LGRFPQILKARLIRFFQFAFDSFAGILSQHCAGRENQPAGPAQQWIDGKVCVCLSTICRL
jgi:hypothetical protein